MTTLPNELREEVVSLLSRDDGGFFKGYTIYNPRIDELIALIERHCQQREVEYNPRAYGKAYKQFVAFQEAIQTGKTVELHAKDYVAMSRNQYDKLQDMLSQKGADK